MADIKSVLSSIVDIQNKTINKLSFNTSSLYELSGMMNSFFDSTNIFLENMSGQITDDISGQITNEVNEYEELFNVNLDSLNNLNDKLNLISGQAFESWESILNSVKSVNGLTGDVQLDVHDIKYETVSGLMLSSYVYYTVSSVLTGDIQYAIPPGLHDTMIKFTTGPSAEFTISVDEKMQLNKEFNFEGNKSYVLAVDNGMVFWNELTEELEPPEPTGSEPTGSEPAGEYLFEVTGAGMYNGRYKLIDPPYDFTPNVGGLVYYINEAETYTIYWSVYGNDWYIGELDIAAQDIYMMIRVTSGASISDVPWEFTLSDEEDDLKDLFPDFTITPIV